MLQIGKFVVSPPPPPPHSLLGSVQIYGDNYSSNCKFCGLIQSTKIGSPNLTKPPQGQLLHFEQTDFLFKQVKLTKISYFGTLFIVQLISNSGSQDSVYTGFSLYRVQFMQVSVYTGFSLYRVQFMQVSIYTGFSLCRFQFIQGSFYTGFSLCRFQFIQDSVYAGFSLYRVQFIQGSVYAGFSLYRVQFMQGSVYAGFSLYRIQFMFHCIKITKNLQYSSYNIMLHWIRNMYNKNIRKHIYKYQMLKIYRKSIKYFNTISFTIKIETKTF